MCLSKILFKRMIELSSVLIYQKQTVYETWLILSIFMSIILFQILNVCIDTSIPLICCTLNTWDQIGIPTSWFVRLRRVCLNLQKFQKSLTTSADFGISCILPIQLHETQGRGCSGSRQSRTCYRVSISNILPVLTQNVYSSYNGTPRGLKNCNEGGCPHCNGSANSSAPENGCVCLHAEENALLEAGRERIGKDCVLYCNTYVICLSDDGR